MGFGTVEEAYSAIVDLELQNRLLVAEIDDLKEQLESLDFDLEHLKTENYDLQQQLDAEIRGGDRYEPED
jgi:regulator of replication initiation timing